MTIRPSMLADLDVERIRAACHPDPFAVLGVHADAPGALWLRCFVPGAVAIELLGGDGHTEHGPLQRRHADGFFEGACPAAIARRLPPAGALGRRHAGDARRPLPLPAAAGRDGRLADGRRHAPAALRGAGRHAARDATAWPAPASRCGRRTRRASAWSATSTTGTAAATRCGCAANAACGRSSCPASAPARATSTSCARRARPGAAAEGRPVRAASRVAPGHRQHRRAAAAGGAAVGRAPARQRARRADQHLRGAPGLVAAQARRRQPLAELGRAGRRRWCPTPRDMGFTHLELLPISEHPFDGSWGYQPIGLYAPTARFGEPAGLPPLRRRAAMPQGLGVLLDWVPAHFPTDAHGLANFDGTAPVRIRRPARRLSPRLEHADLQLRPHRGAQLPGRQRAVLARALRRRRPARRRGGVDAVPRLQPQGRRVGAERARRAREPGGDRLPASASTRWSASSAPQAVTLAEESTAFPAVSRPTYAGGLGFHYKWNMGWMHDTLQYMARDPVHRKHHHGEITFGAGLRLQRELRAAAVARRGGARQGLAAEQDAGRPLAEVRQPARLLRLHVRPPGQEAAVHGRRVRAGARVEPRPEPGLAPARRPRPRRRAAPGARPQPPLSRARRRCTSATSRPRASSGSTTATRSDRCSRFARRGDDAGRIVVAVCNFTPTVHHGYRIGVPEPGVYRERINTDSAHYGGSNVGSAFGEFTAEPIAWHGRRHSIGMTLPPLATVLLERSGLTDMRLPRASGVLLHPTSLPGPHGSGDFGPAAYALRRLARQCRSVVVADPAAGRHRPGQLAVHEQLGFRRQRAADRPGRPACAVAGCDAADLAPAAVSTSAR